MSLQDIKRNFNKRVRGSRGEDINPDEIFIDSSNLPQFDTDQFEGRIEKPISKSTILILGLFFVLLGILFSSRLWFLQIKQGQAYSTRSENNRLHRTLIFPNRGVIYDRNNVELATNAQNTDDPTFALRKYTDLPGLSHVLGYIKYPKKDSSGFYIQDSFVAKDGVEKQYDDLLSGEMGSKITETDARGKVQSEGIIQDPKNGDNVTLSVDAKVQGKLYTLMSEAADQFGFKGGAGVIMNVHSGEILSMVSFPEYKSDVMTSGADAGSINQYFNNKNTPLLNRAISGLYTPGSTIKPFLALGVLNEHLIDPQKQILSTGSISLPNPYDPEHPSIFKDWRPQGWVDMKAALAVSSDVYFYEVGGGFEGQKGLGIDNIDKYARMFGFGDKTGIDLLGEVPGTIPNQAWKKANFTDGLWRIGDTYHTSIGQYGFQVTPLEMARGIAAVANNGTLVEPTLLVRKDGTPLAATSTPIGKNYFTTVQEGMRQAVTEGTAASLLMPSVAIAAKTGTAELGTAKQLVNSWSVGFWPYEKPQYSFAIIMEKGPVQNQIDATHVMKQLFEWMTIYTPQYLGNQS